MSQGLTLFQQAAKSFGENDWRTLLTFMLSVMAAVEGDPGWQNLPKVADLIRTLEAGENTEATLTCQKCHQPIVEAQWLSYQGEPLCRLCAAKLPPNDKASVKVRQIWR